MRKFSGPTDWNHRQAGNAVLRLIERYKELHHGTHPHSLALPVHYINSLTPEFRDRIFGVSLIVKSSEKQAA